MFVVLLFGTQERTQGNQYLKIYIELLEKELCEKSKKSKNIDDDDDNMNEKA